MFPYAPKVYQDYLAANLPDVRVGGDVPVNRPARLITVRTAPAGSSPKPRVLSLRRLVFHIWDDAGELHAGVLAEQVRDLCLRSATAGIGARRVVIVGEPSRFDDPSDPAAKPRFQMTVDVLFRANV